VDTDLLRERAEQMLALSARLQGGKESSSAAPLWQQSLCWADRPPEKESVSSQVISVFVVVGLTLPYYVCIGYTSWFIDEGFAIYRNPDAKGETALLEVLQHDFWGTSLNPPEGYNTHKSFRPLITLLYAAEWQLAARLGFQGREMQLMRAVSCVVHTVSSVETLWLLRRLHVPVVGAVLGAAVFAAHPIHVENIVYLVGTADAAATAFSVSSVLLYLRLALGPRPRLPWWGYVTIVLLTTAAGLCKEPGFTTLFFLACAEIVLRARSRHVAGLMVCFAMVGGLRTWYVGGTEAGFGYIDTPIRYMDGKVTRTLSYLFQHAYYAKLLVLPWHQSWDYSYDALPMVRSLEDLRLLAILAAYLSVVALAAFGLHTCWRQPVTILGLGLIIIPFVPASNLFFLVGTTIGERLLYPCTVGWGLLTAMLATQSVTRGRRVFRCAVVGLVLIYVWNSIARMGHWRSPQVLFLTDADHWGRSAKVLHSKGSELQAVGDIPGALHYYLKSLEVFDDQAITDYCIARCLINLDRLPEALARFDKILNGHGIGLHDGNDFLWMTDLGYLLVKLGSHQQGASYLQEGLQRMPYSCFAWNALGVAQAQLGQLEQAVQSLLEGLQCDPNGVSLWSNLAVVYAYGNAANQATEALQRAIALNASHPVVAHNSRVLWWQAPAGAQPQFDLYIPLPGRR